MPTWPPASASDPAGNSVLQGSVADALGVGEEKPGRPSLPLLLLPLLALWLSCCLGEKLVWEQADPLSSPAVLYCACAASLLAPLLAWALRLPLQVAFSAGAFSLGLFLGLSYWLSLEGQMERLAEKGDGLYTVKVIGDPRLGGVSPSSLAKVRMDDGIWVKVRLRWGEAEPAPLGSCLVVQASLEPLQRDNDYHHSLHQDGCVCVFKVDEAEEWEWGSGIQGQVGALRHAVLERVEDNRRQKGAQVLEGVVLGYRSTLSQDGLYDSFRICGLSHLVAVSGSHLAVVAGMLSWLLANLKRGRRTTFIITASILVLYVLFTGLQASALRSCIMTLLGSLAWLFGRRKHSLSSLSLAAVGMILVDPSAAFSLGFRLSVCAVFGISALMPLVRSWLTLLLPEETLRPSDRDIRARKVVTKLFDLLALTLTATWSTLPLALPQFATLSLVGPLANLLAAPLVTLLIGVGILGSILVPILPGLAALLLDIACLVGQATASLVLRLAAIPSAAVHIEPDALVAVLIGFSSLLLLWFWWPQPSRANLRRIAGVMVALPVAWSLLFLMPVRAQVVMLDVGQGDAFLIRQGWHALLVDTGNEAQALQLGLQRCHVARLDAVLLTHLDTDHCGSLQALEGSMQVGQVIIASGTDTETLPSAVAFAQVDADQWLTLSKDITLQVVWPHGPVQESANEESLSFILWFRGEPIALFTGDAEAETILSMGVREDICILKVPHHGSADAVSQELLKQFDPEIALISVGEGNSYGHPTKETLSLLEGAGVQVHRSDKEGTVKLLLSQVAAGS